MKKYTILILALVLTMAVFAGCGCRSTRPVATTVPTTEMTKPTTEATTEATTHATTMPTEHTDATVDHGNGPLPTDETNGTQENSRARRVPGGH